MDAFTFDLSKMKLMDKSSSTSIKKVRVILDNSIETFSFNYNLNDLIGKRMEKIANEITRRNLTIDNLLKLNVFLGVEEDEDEDEEIVESIIKANLKQMKQYPIITILKSFLPEHGKVKIEAIVGD